MKNIIVGICASIFFLWLSFGYTPIQEDISLLASLENTISGVSSDKLEKVHSKVELYQWIWLDPEGRIYYILDALRLLLVDEMLVRARKEEAIMWELSLDFWFWFRRDLSSKNEDIRYWFRMWLSDKRANLKNALIQVRMPDNTCVELLKDNLPEDFTLFSTDNGTTWTRKNKKLISRHNIESDTDYLCGVTNIKIELPKIPWFFETWNPPFWIAVVVSSSYRWPDLCFDILWTADNAQYEERELCFDLTKNLNEWIGRIGTDVSSLIQDWYITVR